MKQNSAIQQIKLKDSLVFLILLSVILSITTPVHALLADYTFAQSTTTYTEITGGTLLGSTVSDDQQFVDPAVPAGGTIATGPGLPIGFSFSFNEDMFDVIAINNNGWISFGQSALGSSAVNISSTSSYLPLSSTMAIAPAQLTNRVAAFSRDLQAQTGAALRMQTIGTAPERVCVIQWKGYRRYNAAGESINCQIRLYETLNKVAVVYGTFTAAATIGTVQVGMRGPNTTDYVNRATTTNWSATTAGAINTATCTFSSTIIPPNGLTFEYSPPAATPYDLQAMSIAGSITPSVGASSDYTIGVRNGGTVNLGNGSYSVKIMSGTTELASAAGLAVDAGATINVIVPWTPTTSGVMSIFGKVVLAGDSNTSNDQTTPMSIEVFPEGTMIATIGDGILTQRYPLGAYYGYERDASLYTHAQIDLMGTITGLQYYCGATATAAIPYRIYLKTTTETALTAVTWADMITGATLVAEGSYVFNQIGWTLLPFSYSYPYTSNNLVVMIETNFGGGGASLYPLFRYTTSAANSHLTWAIDNAPPTGSGTLGTSRPNVRIQMAPVNPDPLFEVSPSSHNYGQLLLNAYYDKTFIITNNGGGMLTINSIAISGSPFYTPQTLPTFPVDLATGQSTNFVARYSPTAAGTHNATITITDNLTEHFVPLTASCIDPIIYTLPYVQNFDAVTTPNLPIEWAKLTVSPGTVITTTGTPYSAPNCAYIYNSTSTDGPYLISAPVDSAYPINTLKVKFRAKGASGYNLSVGALSDPANAATYMQTTSIALSSAWTEYLVRLSSYTGSGQYIAFKHGNAAIYQGIYIDNVSIEVIPQNDLSAISVTGTTTPLVGIESNYTVNLVNEGAVTQSAYLVKLYNSANVELASVAGLSINPGLTAQAVIPWTPSTPGELLICAKVILTGDENSLNDQSANLIVNVLPAEAVVVTVGDGIVAQRQPFGIYFGYERSATLITQAQIGITGSLTGLQWYCATTSVNPAPYKIYIKPTTLTALVAATWTSMLDGAILVKEGTYTFNQTGWTSFYLTAPYIYSRDNLIVMVETFYGVTGTAVYPYFNYTTGAAGCHQYWNADNTPPTGVGAINALRPNIQLNLLPPEYSITTASYDFGSVTVGDSLYVNYTIENIGEGALSVTALTFNEGQFGDFVLVNPPSLPVELARDETLTFGVAFMPTDTGARAAELRITESTNPVEHIYNITGNSITPTISALPNPLSPVVQEASITSVPLTIYNTGAGRLDFSLGTPTTSWLSLEPLSGSVTTGDSVVVHVIINSYGLEPSAISEVLTLFTNDIANPNYQIMVYPSITLAPVAANFSADPLTGHAPLTVSFTDLSRVGPQLPADSISAWQWDFQNDGIIDSYDQNPSFTYNQPGVYSVRLTVLSSNGMTSSILKTNHITATNQAPIISSVISPIVMAEDIPFPHYQILLSSYFSDPDGLGDVLTYTVSGNVHLTVSINNATCTIEPPNNWTGQETLVFTATDPFGASVSQTVLVTVNPVNDSPLFNPPSRFYFLTNTTFTVNFGDYITDSDTPLAQISISIVNTSPSQQIQLSYSANTPGALTGTFTAQTGFLGTEHFHIVINDNVTRATCTSAFDVQVINQLVPQATVSTDSGYTGQQVQFNDTTLGNPNQWSWSFGDGVTSTLANPVHTFQNPGTYYAHLTIENSTSAQPAVTTDSIAIVMTGILAQPEVNSPQAWHIVGSQTEYNVFDNVNIAAGGSLTISPGITVNVFDTTAVNVTGVLNAANVTFRPIDNDVWSGLRFNSSAQTSHVTNCTVTNATSPVVINGGNVHFENSTISFGGAQIMEYDGTAMQIIGASSPNLINVGINNYSRGIIIQGSGTSGRSTPTLTNIRVRNSTNSSRDETDKTALEISGEVNPIIDNIEIINCDYGIKLSNSSSLNTTTPTIHGVRIINEPANSVPGLIGLSIQGNVQVALDSLYIDNYATGLRYQDYTPATSRTTPTLTNIRVRNSTNSSRNSDIGVVFDNVKDIQFTNSDIDSMSIGIRIQSSESRATSTPTLTNIRVRNSTNSSRFANTGMEITGYVSPQFNDILIEDYIQGLNFTGTGSSLRTTTPTLTNIRVRNSTNSSRVTSVGVVLKDVVNVVAADDTIEGYSLGMEITNNAARTTSTPTLTNIRVRNSTNSSRQDDTAIYLGANVAGTMSDCLIEEAKIGIFIADGNATELSYNLFKNCGIGLKASGYTTPMPIKNNVFKLDAAWQSTHTWTYSPISIQYTGPWNIYHNTMWGYDKALTASFATIDFMNNIVWDDLDIVSPFDLTTSINTYTYNDIRKTGEFTPGSGNFNANPFFANPVNDDFRLTYNSPCIDTGNPASPHDPDSTVTDIGAYFYLHKASFTPLTVSASTGTVVNFENTSLGHDDPLTVVAWDLNNDGIIESDDWDWSYQFNTPGTYDIKLKLTTGALVDSIVCLDAVVIADTLLNSPQNVGITNIGNDIVLCWEAVTETINHQPVGVNYYIVYKSLTPDGEYLYQNYTSGGVTEFTDVNGALEPEGYYFIIAFAGTLTELLDYILTHGSYQFERGQSTTIVPFKTKK
jgi:PKD repeat protein